MKQFNEILKLIEFPNFIEKEDFEKENIESSQIISESKKKLINGNFIDYYLFKKRTNGENWKSIDIYIKPEKVENVLKLLYNFSLKRDIFDTKSNKKFEESNDNYVFYSLKSESKIRLDILKSENKLAFLLTKFK